MKIHTLALALIVCTATWVSSAEAQQARSAREVQVEVDGTFVTTARSFSDTAAPLIHAEPGQLTAAYDVPRAAAFTIGGHVRVWRQLSAGVSYGQSSRSTSAQITGSLPHPFFFSRNRQIAGDVSNATRKDATVAVHLRAAFPVARQTMLSVFGGPAWIAVTQSIVEQVNFSESYPYDTASFTSASVRNAKHSKAAFQVGTDVTHFFSRRFGVGGGFRYSAATVNLPSLDSDVLKIKAGGLDVTTGIRLRF
jgi:hypothetical protein